MTPATCPSAIDCRPPARRWPRGLAAVIRGVRAHAGLAAVLLLAAALLWPMLRSGFYYDDIKNSCVAGMLQFSGSSLGALIRSCIVTSMTLGRVYPGALAITFTLHYWCTSAVAYKALLLTLTLVNLLQFYGLLRGLRLSKSAAQLCTLAVVLLFQMRAFGDPLLAFAGIMQMVTGQLLLSLVCLQRYCSTARRGWLAASVAMYITSLLTYEISYCFLPAYLALCLAQGCGWRRALAAAAPYALVACILTAYTFGLRYGAPSSADNTYRFSLDPDRIARTTAAQASAALPASYALLSPHRPLYFDAQRAAGRWDNWLLALAAGGLAALLLRQAVQERSAEQLPAFGWLAALGAVVWILPGVPIALSAKYQACVEIGLGYLPVYVQYYGVAILLSAAVLGLAASWPRLRRPLTVGAAVASAAVALITADTNRHLVDVCPSTANNRGQQLVEAALRAGLANEVPDNASLVAAGVESIELLRCGPPLSSSFVSQVLERKIHALCIDEGPGADALRQELLREPASRYVLSVHCQPGQRGCVLLGPLEPGAAAGRATVSQAREFRLFVAGDEDSQPGPGWALYVGAGDLKSPAEIHLADLKLLARVPAGALYSGDFHRPVDLTTVVLRQARAVAELSPCPPAAMRVSMTDSGSGSEE